MTRAYGRAAPPDREALVNQQAQPHAEHRPRSCAGHGSIGPQDPDLGLARMPEVDEGG
jgi:hypothetical protein